jgi:hypothetical protein
MSKAQIYLQGCVIKEKLLNTRKKRLGNKYN